ncbi:hypothetical protein ACS0TY_016503 [Phlomoides rotata]
MRAGACAAQQTLSAEAASVLKLSLTLARRRGHAQVTPLHVAATLLSSRASLLRRACLKSQPHQPSHPLQCRALELCFNVALNRLPAAPGPLLHAQPSLSNALIAALKRAQAHQRRGCIEQQQQQQQQPLLTVKVELDQLVLSILDDPSVSRVMREAGFSSTSVKNNLEDSNIVSSVFQCYNTFGGGGGGIYSTPNSPPTDSHLQTSSSSFWHPPHLLPYTHKKPINEDIRVVLQVLAGKKRKNVVIISDSVHTTESLISELIRKVEFGLDVPDELRSTQLVKFQFSSVPLMLMNKEEVEMNVADLKRKVDSLSSSSGGRVIIYVGDLKWAVDEREGGFSSTGGYNPVDHLIVEIGKLVGFYNRSSMRVWLIATANYQTYMKCQMKQPPLDLQWALQAVSVPSGGLGLSLNATSGRDNSRIAYSENSSPVKEKKLFCLEDEAEALTCCPECISNYDKEAASPQLPYWLNSHSHAPLQKEDLDQLRRKYNKLCQNVHQGSPNPHNSSWNHYSYPYKKNIFSDSETISFLHPKTNQSPSSLPRFRRQQSCHIEFSFNPNNKPAEEPNLDSLKDKEEKITLALGNSYTDSQKSAFDHVDLYRAFKENVPWQSATFPLMIEALKGNDKMILMQGNDRVGKRRLAAAIADSTSTSLLCIKREKTGRENQEMVERAMRNHEKLVVLVEDADFADPLFLMFVFDGVSRRRNDVFLLTIGENIGNEEVNSVVQMRLIVGGSCNVEHKRKAEEMVEVSSNSIMNQIRELKRKLSSSVLDLNIKADEDECHVGESGPISNVEEHSSLGFISKIKNRVVFNLCCDQEREAKGMLLMKLRKSFEESSGGKSVGNFNVDEMVLEGVLRGAGSYLNALFEEWLKDVFQTCLRCVNSEEREREKVSFRLCLVGKGELCGEKDGFRGTCLPKRIPVSFVG